MFVNTDTLQLENIISGTDPLLRRCRGHIRLGVLVGRLAIFRMQTVAQGAPGA